MVRGGLWGWDANLTADPDAKGSHGDWGNVVKEAAEGEKVCVGGVWGMGGGRWWWWW